VVQLGAAGDARPVGDQGGRGAGPAALDQTVDRGVQQPVLGRPAALLLPGFEAAVQASSAWLSCATRV